MSTPPNAKRRRATSALNTSASSISPSSSSPSFSFTSPTSLSSSSSTPRPSSSLSSSLASPSSSSSPASDPAVEAQFLGLCQQHPAGIRSEQFTALHPSVPLTSLILSINALLSRGRLTLLSDSSTTPPTPYYRHASSSDASRLSGLSAADLVIYQMIAKEGNRGIWIRDLRRRSQLTAVEVPRALKALMGRRLVKAERSIEGKNKKVYMLYDLEPAKEVKGSSWYGGGEFDAEFIDALRSASLAFIGDADDGDAGRSVQEVSDFLRSTGAFHVQCSVEEMELVLNALVLDGLLTSNGPEAGGGGLGKGKRGTLYRVQRGGAFVSDVVHVPCVLCPVRSACSEEPGSVISPYTCEYYRQWLDF